MAKLADLKALYDAGKAATGGTRVTPSAPSNSRGANGTAAVPKNGHARATTPRAPVANAKRALAAAKHADGDIDLAQAFADVTRLRAPNRAAVERPRPAPVARQREIDEQDALESSKYGAEPSPHLWDVGQEHEAGQTFVRPGVRTDVLGKLRRGRYSVQAELDLHGLNSEESRDALADFLLDARNRGLRCVRVIHGKGLTSPNKEPVLKGKVRQWLSHWDDVLAYSEAPPHAGGGGAVVVLLRGAK